MQRKWGGVTKPLHQTVSPYFSSFDGSYCCLWGTYWPLFVDHVSLAHSSILPSLFPFTSCFLSQVQFPDLLSVGVSVMTGIVFHARLVLTLCVSSSWLHHYVTWTVFFPPSFSWTVFPSLQQLFSSYVNNLDIFAILLCKVMDLTDGHRMLKWASEFL